MSAAAAPALALGLLFVGGGAPLPAGGAAVRLELAGASAARVFGPRGERLTVAEWSGDRTGRARFVRFAPALSAAWAPRPRLRLEVRLPLVVAAASLEARDAIAGAHVATDRRRSFGLGDAELAVLARVWERAEVSADLGLWGSAPTGRPLALVPTSDGLFEAGPIARARLALGSFASLGAEGLWRVRPTGWPDRLAARLVAGFAPRAAAWAVAAGLRADLPLERSRADSPRPAFEAADNFSPDPAPLYASTAPARARLDATLGALVRAGRLAFGAQGFAAVWGRADAAAFGLGAFVEFRAGPEAAPAPARAP